MGGAETGHGGWPRSCTPHTGWESEIHTTCTLDPHTWVNELEPGTVEVNGVPVHRHCVTHGRLPDFYGLDGIVRARAPGGDAGAGRLGHYNGPVSTELVDAVAGI